MKERKREMAGVVVRPLWCRLDPGFRRGVIRTTTTGWRQIALFHSLSLYGSSVGGRRTNFVGGRKGRYSPGYRCSSKFSCFVFLLWFCKGAAVRECRSVEQSMGDWLTDWQRSVWARDCAAASAEAEGEKTCGGGGGGGVGQQLKWERGGGFVDSLANVHSSAIVEVGAVVHAHAHVGPNTHILSGCIVGPNVNVGSSTTLGFASSLSQSPHLFFEREIEIERERERENFSNLWSSDRCFFSLLLYGQSAWWKASEVCMVGDGGSCQVQCGAAELLCRQFLYSSQWCLCWPRRCVHYVSFYLSCCSTVYLICLSFSLATVQSTLCLFFSLLLQCSLLHYVFFCLSAAQCLISTNWYLQPCYIRLVQVLRVWKNSELDLLLTQFFVRSVIRFWLYGEWCWCSCEEATGKEVNPFFCRSWNHSIRFPLNLQSLLMYVLEFFLHVMKGE